MNDKLRTKIEDLIVELINCETRTIREGRDFSKASIALCKLCEVDDLTKLFDDESYDGALSSAMVDKYRYKFVDILKHEPDIDNFSTKYHLEVLKQNVVKKIFEKFTHESELELKAYEVTRLEDKVIELEEKLRYSILEGKIGFMDKVKKYITLPSIIILLVLIISLLSIYLLGKNAELSVAINFNIGEVIGAILAGSGIAVAGFSYAMKKPNEDKENRR